MTLTERALTAAGLVRRSSAPAVEGGADPTVAVKRALTAAAGRLRDPLGGKSRGGIRGDDWQKRAWDYYDTLGEIQYAATFYGANLSRVRLLVEKLNEEGEWEEETAGEAFDLLDAIRGPRGDRSDLQRAYGEIQFIAAEGYLFAAAPPASDESPEVVWEFLSGDEVRVEAKDRKVVRRAAANDRRHEVTYVLSETFQPADGEAVALRLWTPHPRHSADPKSAMQGVLDACEELRLLPRAVRSRARSRLTAGILAIPSEMGDRSGKPGMDENPEEDIFLNDLIDAASTAITDEDSAAATIPLLLRADAEHLDKIHHIPFVDPAAAYPETEREVHVIRRIAQGLNLPPEVLIGMADANHWSAWQISEAIWTAHLEPVAQQLCGDLTSAYLAPQLSEGADQYRVWYDDAGLVTKPDRAGDAQQLHDRLAISDEALRDASDFEETDAPDEEEMKRRIGVLLRDASLATGGEVTPPTPIVNNGGPPTDEPAAGPSTTEKGPPTPEDEAAVTAAAVGVARARCRAAAGARVLTRLQKERAPRPDLNGVRQVDVCAVLGEEAIRALGLDPAALVAGGAECLVDASHPRALAAAVEQYAARTLFDAAPPAVAPTG